MKPSAGCRGGIIPYSVTRVFRRTSNLWQRPLTLLPSDKGYRQAGPCGTCRSWMPWAGAAGAGRQEEDREAGTWGDLLRDGVNVLQTAHPGHLSKARGLCQAWVPLLRHHSQPLEQQHRQMDSRQRVTQAYVQSSHHLLPDPVHGWAPTHSPKTAVWL